MSGYPDTGNVLISICAVASPEDRSVLQVEEIIFDGPDVEALAQHLRGEERAMDMRTEAEVSRDKDRIVSSLEAKLTWSPDGVGWSPGEESPIASDLLCAFGSHLARSAEWVFSPAMEIDVLGLTEGERTQCRVVSQSSPPDEPADGDATIATPRGNVSVHQRGGYLRVASLRS